jgi:hypothetical protein
MEESPMNSALCRVPNWRRRPARLPVDFGLTNVAAHDPVRQTLQAVAVQDGHREALLLFVTTARFTHFFRRFHTSARSGRSRAAASFVSL